jgi:hypothetical protein
MSEEDGIKVANGPVITSDGIKMLTTFFAGIILTGAASFAAYPKNLPTKDDIAESQKLTEVQITSLEVELSAARAEVAALQVEVTRERVQIGKISYKLNIPDNQ